MAETIAPLDVAELREAVAWAAAEATGLRIVGGGTQQAIGRPVAAEKMLRLDALSGVVFYEPDELVLRARPSTPVRTIEAMLAEQGQHLAFEPRRLGGLFGTDSAAATLGGLVSVGLAGPRRLRAGSVRDAVLGVGAVTGRGEIIQSGGRVMKNVTGYDMPKLFTGAYGTLGVIHEITLKVAPAPEDERTVLLAGLGDRAAVAALRDGLATPFDPSGAAHLPVAVAQRSNVPALRHLGAAATVLRLEGTAATLGARVDGLLTRLRRPGYQLGPLAERGGALVLDAVSSRDLWREIADVQYFAEGLSPLWKVSTAPMQGPSIVEALAAEAWFYDWAGGLLWLLMGEAPRADEALIRRALEGAGGHATLMRAPEEMRATLSVFEPQPEALAGLTRRIKEAFDPARILNPGLLYPDV